LDVTTTAMFVERHACISCNDPRLRELSSGRFDEEPLRAFIDDDPWGENPSKFLKGQKWSFVRCENCGLAFHRNILSPEWNERRFSTWMSQEAISAFEARLKTPTRDFDLAATNVEHVLRIEQLTRSIRGSSAPRLLDFGCGYGAFLSMCSQFGFHAIGVDRSEAKRDHNRFFKVFAEIDEVANEAPFHALTLFQVLEHLDDPREILLKLRGMLAEDAVLVLETPDCSGIEGIRTRNDYYQIHPLEHINAFTAESMRDFAQRVGFKPIAKPVAWVTADSRHALKRAAKRLLRPVLRSTTELYFRKS
jgi:2-polyprenyl-3-methyl-5-hydroxy-6-metoxy-1,4-benzoquinol methylase